MLRRAWIGCFLATSVLFLLQLFPLTGIFLMFVVASHWSAVLINLGFALMALDALTNKSAPFSFLIFPLLYFGGYVAVAYKSHQEADRFNESIVSYNSGKFVNFDATKNDVVMPFTGGSDISARGMINEFGLDVAYDLVKPATGDTVRLSLSSEHCREKNNKDGKNLWVGITVWEPVGPDHLFYSSKLCIDSDQRKPERPAFRIDVLDETYTRAPLLNTGVEIVEITYPDGATTVLRAGRAYPLTWLPTPIIGCALNSGNPSWDCFASFAKERYDRRDIAPNAVSNVVAKALGLKRTSLRDRYPDAGWESALAKAKKQPSGGSGGMTGMSP